ncbi:4-(cytidine 5'-diphospho)-2-C-methyl-D-erythritol kinase [Brevundimonas sp. Root1423]|uniref:4-(cytidine 5'-diphospho)-2-C-methyl-D-erythritol kinase n=1 Tax=Brevundimonas sp. Root1423 TaxID=1736462 RepID=UPI0006F3BD41|nr:4-(cytidine 5'-diphospho)-2-C-methyl-D-erythritol kinase [Brevundimonas sp. Root1423]KQY84650.1 4-diphosphocytidyl-2C-methyl-D-erythritol kinase [Brevundimonas sp. Root1423]
MAPVRIFAPAKVNLFLHVGPVAADGYHPLASLVAFADVGDGVTVEPARSLSLAVAGPFGSDLDGGGDNLILKALRALGQTTGAGDPPVSVTLDKQLPIAAGLGGGSSDAGAALKAVRDLLDLPLNDDALADIAAAVGADGPMCLHARAAWAEDRGDRLTFEPRLPPLPAVLINPGVPSPTGAVYRAWDEVGAGGADRPDSPADWAFPAVIDWLARQRNDLEAPAVALQPAIAVTLSEAGRLPGVRLVRMSGSGATVFALFDTSTQAAEAAGRLTSARPDWWVRSAILR